MITLKQLTDELGDDRVLGTLEALGLNAKESYEDNDPELAQIRQHAAQPPAQNPEPQQQQQQQSTTQPTGKKGSKKTTSAAIAKVEKATQQSKGALVQGAQQAATAAITQAKRQGQQLGDQANREMVGTFLEVRAEGMKRLGQSLNEASDTINEIGENVFLGVGVDAEAEDFLSQSGAFSLL